MDNKEVNWIEKRGRLFLKDVLPLNTPLKIEVEPSFGCNFKCIYCLCSQKTDSSQFMSLDLFDKIINGAKKFPKKIKSFNFTGRGEPMLNKNIYEMIKKANNIAEETVLITNGSLLTRDNADKLIDANIKIIRVSLQGINEQDYYDISRFKINFNNFLNNLKYLYEHKKDTKLFLKMPDISIATDNRKKIFYELFQDKSDFLVIQNIDNLTDKIDYSNIVISPNTNNVIVCPQPFYSIYVNYKGECFPCCHTEYTRLKIDTISDSTNIYDIWNSNNLKDFRITQLKSQRYSIEECSKCNILNYYYNIYDYIDEYKNDLLKKYL